MKLDVHQINGISVHKTGNLKQKYVTYAPLSLEHLYLTPFILKQKIINIIKIDNLILFNISHILSPSKQNTIIIKA